jgi:hypothetical protein
MHGRVAPLRERYREQRGHQCDDGFGREAIGAQPLPQLREPDIRRIVSLLLQPPLEMLDHRIEGTIGVIGRTVKDEARTLFAADVCTHMLDQAGFPNAWLATQDDHLPRSVLAPGPAFQEQRHVRLTADQGG